VPPANDDIIAFGGSRRQAERDEAIEDLFQAHYPRLVLRALALLGDRDLAEQVSTQAYLSLYRHWGRLREPGQAPAYLDESVTRLAAKIADSGGRRSAEPRPTDADPDHVATDKPAVNTARAWREFLVLRDRASRNRRRQYMFVAAAATASAAIAATVALAVLRVPGPSLSSNRPPVGPGERHTTRPSRSTRLSSSTRASSVPPANVRSYPRAVITRIPLSGVQYLAQDGNWLWAVQMVPPPGPLVARHFNLVKIGARTGRMVLRLNLGQNPVVVAAGEGTVWLTRPDQARQVARINPATGKVMMALRLRAARNCGYLTFVAGELWAECGSGKSGTVFLRLDPVAGHVLERLGPVRGPVGFQSAFTPGSVWYYNDAGLNWVVPAHGRRGFRALTLRGAAYPSFVYAKSLVYEAGAVWVLTNDESIAKIDPASGHIERVFTCRNFDPACQVGLDFMTAGEGSLWFMDDGYSKGHQTTSVLRVSMATGKLLGRVNVHPGSCGQPCYQIYAASGTIWVPTLTELIGIDPARLPA